MAASRVAVDLIERHGAAWAGGVTAAVGGILGVVDGVHVSTLSITAVIAAASSTVAVVIRSLTGEIRSLRARLADLEAREDRRLDSLESERADLLERIRCLEARLVEDDGR